MESSGSGDSEGDGALQALARVFDFLLPRLFGKCAKTRRTEALPRLTGYSKADSVMLRCKNCENLERMPGVFQNAEDFVCAE